MPITTFTVRILRGYKQIISISGRTDSAEWFGYLNNFLHCEQNCVDLNIERYNDRWARTTLILLGITNSHKTSLTSKCHTITWKTYDWQERLDHCREEELVHLLVCRHTATPVSLLDKCSTTKHIIQKVNRVQTTALPHYHASTRQKCGSLENGMATFNGLLIVA